MNKTPAVILNVQRQPGGNTISVVKSIKQLLPQLEANLPTADRCHDADRPDDADPGVGERRGIRADADRRRWW